MVYKKVDLEKVRKQAAGIRLLVLDVDGVLTDGRLHFDTFIAAVTAVTRGQVKQADRLVT